MSWNPDFKPKNMDQSQSTSFDPDLLLKCLAISEHLSQKKTGTAKLEVNLGSSKFFVSADHSSENQAGKSNLMEKKIRNKKKTPSDIRRNARRLEKFLEEKRKLISLPASSSSPSTDEQNSADLSKLSLISETPMVNVSSEAMEEDGSDKANVDQPTLEKRIPVIIARNENPVIVNELTHNLDSEMLSESQYLSLIHI